MPRLTNKGLDGLLYLDLVIYLTAFLHFKNFVEVFLSGTAVDRETI